jgi:hypothetical protein
MSDNTLFRGTINAQFLYEDQLVKVMNINYRPNKQVTAHAQVNPDNYTTISKLLRADITHERKGTYFYDPDYIADEITDKFNHEGIWVHKTKSKVLLNQSIINTTLIKTWYNEAEFHETGS